MSLISVIIPVYNREKYVSEAIESVLKQTYQFLDIIVIDDGSTDKSAEIIKSFGSKIRYFYQENSGISSALNHGLKVAKGEFIAFLDSDDLWTENKLNLQIKVLKKNTQVSIVFAHIQQFISPELDTNIQDKIDLPNEIMKGYVKGTMLAKKEVFSQIGLFDISLKLGDFIDWYLKACEQGIKSFVCPEVLLKRRIHDTNMGIIDKKDRSDYVKIIKASLDRRRHEVK
ncbi:polysaccharide biosynthesis glycosyl transferase CpsJ [Geminocystis sp. NIES-3708]|uniref:glycosyltransferase n=1 Tax=Geminocystis sp. NIES-3708 TaxID=1615909 RepID=UPI0005FC7406|nr:glycosyltransferase [Geminocystis sp. NIES-3708]BAQ61470.1 polysaccharide biosynthesis glycosyl transferase CpsJ [Geminocystis sp. NIES-3708]